MSKVQRDLSRFSAVVAFLVFASSEVRAADPAQSGQDVTQKIQGYYASIGDYEARFVQTVAHKMFAGRLDRTYGKVFFRKGGLMRWEYERPEKKLFVYDGKTLWVYEPEVPQVFSGSADTDRLRRGLAFLTGEGKILDDYKAKVLDSKLYGFAEGIVVGLTPIEKNPPFKMVELYVDKTTYRVVRSVVVDHEGNRNRLDFLDVAVNKNLPQSQFQFIPPAGVPVIDAASQQ